MEDYNQLAMMPDDVIMYLMDLLPLADLKALSRVNRRISALAGRVIAARQNVYLCLSRRSAPALPSRMIYIDPQVLRNTQRRYRNLAVTCSRQGPTSQLQNALREVPVGWSIQAVHLSLRRPASLVNLMQNSTKFATINRMTVVTAMRSNPNGEYIRLWASFPELRHLTWIDHYGREPREAIVRLNVYAPKLQTLTLLTSNSSLPNSMRLFTENAAADQSIAIDSWDVSAHTQLTALVCNVSVDVQATLFQHVLPSVESLECRVMDEAVPELWRRLGTALPNLRHLRVLSGLDRWTGESLFNLRHLEWLELQGGSISLPAGSVWLVPSLRRVCLTSCELSGEQCQVELPAVESLCLLACYRLHDRSEHNWILPNLRHLYLELSPMLGIGIRQCRQLEYCRLIIRDPMMLIPWDFSLPCLLTLHIECSWRRCRFVLWDILLHTPNLQNLTMHMRGCGMHYLEYLPRFCPQLRKFVLQSDGSRVKVTRAALAGVFALPNIEEIVLDSITVTNIDAPIIIPRQLRILIMQVICRPVDQPLFVIDPDHPAADSMIITTIQGDTYCYAMMNIQLRQPYLRCLVRADPFRCHHIGSSFRRWLRPRIIAEVL